MFYESCSFIKRQSETIHSVITQTYPNIEFFVIDGDSMEMYDGCGL